MRDDLKVEVVEEENDGKEIEYREVGRGYWRKKEDKKAAEWEGVDKENKTRNDADK